MPQPRDREFEINESTVQDANVLHGDNTQAIQGRDNQTVIGNDNFSIDGQGNTVYYNQIPPEKRDSLERALLEEVAKEVDYRQEQSLHKQVFIELGKKQTPRQVNCPWSMEIKVGKQKPEPIPDGQTINQVFKRKDIAGKLLILGHPGAGKTTTMLALAKGLVAQAQQEARQPIPVLFNLSSWRDDKQPIAQWLVRELREKYRVKESLGQALLENKRLLPLLDGLDELAAERQESCVKAINGWLESYQGLARVVVCSRVQEYSTYETVLALNGAICLQPLTISQIEQYLQQTGKLELWSVVSGDRTILELVQVPLWLSVLTLARDELDLMRWQCLETEQERLVLLLDAFVRARLGEPLTNKNCKYYKPKNTPTAKQTCWWLSWLAQIMEQDEFVIEQIQPKLLKTSAEKYQLRLIVGLLGGSIVGLFEGLTWGLAVGFIWGLIGGLTWGIFSGLIRSLDPIDTVEILEINLSSNALKILFQKVLICTSVCVAVGLVWGLALGLLIGLLIGLLWGGVVGVLGGIIWGITWGVIEICKADIQTQVKPNQGILNSGRNTLILLGVSFPLVIFLYWLTSVLLDFIDIFDETQIASLAGAVVLVIVLSVWAYGGGQSYFRHYALRFVLARSGKIPYLYANFLNYCTERLLLQRVGGRFRFLHRTLQEHFAAMPLEDYRQGMKP